MTKIAEATLASAIAQLGEKDRSARELICEEIYMEQPNLLSSILVLIKMDVSPAHLEVVLEALMVVHLALTESGQRIETISEAEQERELQRLVASVTFTEGLESSLLDESIRQYIGFQDEPWLLSYVLAQLQDNGLFLVSSENIKYLVLAALNLVGCIASARAMPQVGQSQR